MIKTSFLYYLPFGSVHKNEKSNERITPITQRFPQSKIKASEKVFENS